jgi:beta-barrel assembly-enhancing protease
MAEKTGYPAMALNDKFENGKVSGEIILTGHSIRFESAQDRVEMSMNGINIRRGGSSNQLVFFDHPSHPGWTLYTKDKSILRHLRRSGEPDVSDKLRDVRKTTVRRRTTILAVAALVAAIIYGLYLLREPVGKSIASSIPVEWEQSLGETVFEQYKADRTFVEDPLFLQSLEKITEPLLTHIPDQRYQFHVYVEKNPAVNAFALPGGYVVLYTGLMTRAKRAEEILGVLAHEISHVTHQHGLRKIIDSIGLSIIVNFLLGKDAGVWGAVLENGSFLLNQKFSRSFEKQADETGFAYLLGAGIDPSGMMDFFQRLHQDRQENDSSGYGDALEFLYTHPTPKKRVNYLQKKWAGIRQRTGFLDFNDRFRAFREQLKKIEN